MEEALRPREPATRCSIVVEREPVLAGKPERDPRRPRQLAVSAEAGVRALTMDDGAALVAEPPERAPEPVERLRRVGGVERLLKRIPRAFPIAARERFVPTPKRGLRRGRRHDRIVAPSQCSCHESGREWPQNANARASPVHQRPRKCGAFLL